MLRHLYIPAVSALLLLASCSKEQPGALAPEAPQTAVSFTFRNYRDAASRATVAAASAEKVIRDVDIFAFSGGQFLAQLADGSGFTETVSGGNSTLNVSPEFLSAYAGKKVVFYFIANNAASLVGSTNDTGKHIAAFSGSEADFVELMASPLGLSPYYPAPPDERSEILSIDPSAGGMLMTGRSAEITLLGKQSVTVALKRRVARFDIVNPVPDKFHISQVMISAAPVSGPVFMQASGTTPVQTRPVEEIGPVVSYNARNRATSVFYLYPTNLATTQITICGWSGDPADKHLFTVNSNIDIIADKCYTLVFDEDELEFVIGNGDWDEGEL